MFVNTNRFNQETHTSESKYRNPWLGLATYNTKNANKFRGRDKATHEVFSLIDNNLVVTLYGKSGIGKSSLINAGVMPMLNNVGYKVVSVNIREIKALCSESKGYVREVVYNHVIAYLSELFQVELDTVDETSLWKILHSKEYFKDISEFPVVIFDQFEEIFLGTTSEDADIFVKAISKLTDTGFSLDDNDYIFNNRYRILLSLREDDLFRLEDCIDRSGFSRMKANRYRLRSLSKSEAEEIIALGKKYFKIKNYNICTEVITELSSLPDGGIDSATLSLLCYRLFEKAKNREKIIITENDIKAENDPLYNLYAEEIESLNLSRKEQIFIENHLITASGRRDITSLENFKRSIGAADKLLENSDSHKSLFRIIDKGEHVELLHDSLAKAVYKYRQVKNDELRSKYRKLKATIVNVLLFLVPVIAILKVYCCCILKNATTTDTKFIAMTELPVILLLAPIFCCIFVIKERRIERIMPLIPLLLVMSINIGLLRCCFGIDLINVFPLLYHNTYLQIFLFFCFLIYSWFLFDTKNKKMRVLSVVYINAVTLPCLWFGFGYDLFKVNNVVKRSGASIPWAYSIVEKDNKYGFVDWHGNEVIPCEFDELIPTLHKSNKEDPDTSFIMAKRVRCLDINNKILSEILNIGDATPPLYYNNN